MPIRQGSDRLDVKLMQDFLADGRIRTCRTSISSWRRSYGSVAFPTQVRARGYGGRRDTNEGYIHKEAGRLLCRLVLGFMRRPVPRRRT